MLCKPDRGTGAQGKSRGGSQGAQKSRWGLRNTCGEPQGAGRGAWRTLGSLRSSKNSLRCCKAQGGLRGAKEGRRRTWGYSEHTQRPQAPQKALGRLWECTHSHTHTHMKGGVGKGKCHLSTTPERAPRGLCWEDLELRQRLLGHSHSLFHARGIPGNSRSRAVATELWLSQAEKSGCVPGDKQQPLSHCWPSHALEAFPSVMGEQSCRPSQGKSQQLLPSKGCFPALLVAVLPQCWWGDLSKCLVFPVCSSQSSVCCASCQPSCGVTGSIRSPKLMQTPPLQHREHREEQGCLSPAFSSGFSFWITLTLCLEHASGCTCYPWTHLAHQHRADAWPGWVCH